MSNCLTKSEALDSHLLVATNLPLKVEAETYLYLGITKLTNDEKLH